MPFLGVPLDLSVVSPTRQSLCFKTHRSTQVLTEGSAEWITWDDGWTVATEDAGRAAQFEHTVLITAEGCEVLT